MSSEGGAFSSYPDTKANAAGCNGCRVCAVVAILLLLAGGGGAAAYFALHNRGKSDVAKPKDSKSDVDPGKEVHPDNLGDKDKPIKVVERFYGLGYSPFGLGGEDGGRVCPPFDDVGGKCLNADQVRADMRLIANMTRRVKTYSLECVEDAVEVLRFAGKNKMEVMLGVWVEKSGEKNDMEVERLVSLLEKFGKGGAVTQVLVGNEAVFIQNVTEKELLRVVTKVKAVVKAAGLDVPVGSAEVFSQWTGKGNDDVEATEPLTAVAKAVDFIGLNVHPYFSGIDPTTQDAGKVVKDERDALAAFFKTAGFERPVFVTETGFPSGGAPHKAGSGTAKPSVAALSAFAKQVETISRDSGMGVYFFEPFDGDWKRRWQKFEAYDYTFGLYKCDRKLKNGLDLPDAKPV